MSDCSCTSSSRPVHSVKELEPLAGVFKALGHPVRLMIVEMLLDGERCVCELQKDSGRDMSTVSSHLNVLKNSRIVSFYDRLMLEPCTRDYRDRIMKIEQEGQSFLLDSLEK